MLALCQDEANTFVCWPLYLAGWMLRGVEVVLGPGWVPLTLAGIAIVAVTLRERQRIDSYGEI